MIVIPEAICQSDTLLIDLDNVLYNADHQAFPEAAKRMATFIHKHCSVKKSTAPELRDRLYDEYGLTVRGLIAEGYLERPDDFIRYTYDVQLEDMRPRPDVAEALNVVRRAGIRPILFTSNAEPMVSKILKNLGLAEVLDERFTFLDTDLTTKREVATYKKVEKTFDLDPSRVTFMDDKKGFLEIAKKQRGYNTVWVREFLWDNEPEACDYVADYRTFHLAQFLKDLADSRSRLGKVRTQEPSARRPVDPGPQERA